MSNTPAAGLTAPDGAVASPTELDARRELAREFQIERLLGQSPIRYLARDAEDRLVTLTVVPRAQLERSAEHVLEPIAAATRLDHPHIARVYGSGTTDSFLWYATRYVEGRTLATLLRTVRSMELAVCLRILEQVASALDYAHRRGVSHGALTAECIVVDANEWVLVGAFGGTELLGSASGDATPAADQRALAVLVRQCLTGGATEAGALPLHVSQALRRALSARTADQFPSVLDFVAALEDRVGAAGPRPEARPAWFGTKPRSARRGGTPLVIADTDQDPAATKPVGKRLFAAAALLVLFALVAAAWMTRSQAPAAPPSRAGPRAPAPAPPPAPPPPPPAPPTPARLSPAAPRATYTPAPAPQRHPVKIATPRPAPARAPAPAQLAEPGLLSVNAIPWGSVYVDGRPIGNTPQLDFSISPGQHRLRVERQGYRPFERVIEVAPGQRLRITDITLTER